MNGKIREQRLKPFMLRQALGNRSCVALPPASMQSSTNGLSLASFPRSGVGMQAVTLQRRVGHSATPERCGMNSHAERHCH